MRRESSGPILTTIFVDYDNIYLSLRRKSEEAAKRFAKDAGLWLRELETGRLITPTNGVSPTMQRRIVMNRCYGNPVPRRNNNDNSTDMNSFPFVRHHFLRSGFEVIDCPPLTAQLKNSSDIRMVMDVRDLLGHDTYFDEFIILSGDADFTPVLHRLRAHARRTVIFANDHTAAPYTSISDGEVREADLISLLLDGTTAAEAEPNNVATQDRVPSITQMEVLRRDLINEVAALVRQAGQPVPLEALADRLVRTLGHDKTVGSGWGGAGGFRELLARALPGELRLSGEPPYYVFDASLRAAAEPIALPPAAPSQPAAQAPAPVSAQFHNGDSRSDIASSQQPRSAISAPVLQPAAQQSVVPDRQQATQPLAHQPAASRFVPQPHPALSGLVRDAGVTPTGSLVPASAQPISPRQSNTGGALDGLYSPVLQQASLERQAQPQPQPQQLQPQQVQQVAAPTARASDSANAIQQSIARIHEACQAPPLSPPEYRALFDAMAKEINANGLTGAQTLANISGRAQELGLDIRRDDVRFVLEVVSESDPWFEQGASAVLFSSRFRNFVVARCRSQGLNLSSDELDLIEAWFAGASGTDRRQSTGGAPPQPAAQPVTQPMSAARLQPNQAQARPATAAGGAGDRWWSLDESRQQSGEIRSERPGQATDTGDEFPRFVRKGVRS